jgi:hypothetical protein
MNGGWFGGVFIQTAVVGGINERQVTRRAGGVLSAWKGGKVS